MVSAADSFTTPGWKAAAQYRGGEYEKAVEQLQGLTGPEATYNRGNALARLGRIEDAIESYEQTLAQQPDHSDASHNLDLLRQLQDQQQQQQSQQQGGDDNEQQQSDDQQGGQSQNDNQSNNQNDSQSGNQGEASNENQNQADQTQSTAEQSGSSQQTQQPETAQAGEQEQSQEQAGMEQSDKIPDQQPAQQTGPDKDESEAGQQAQAEPDQQQTEQQQAMEQWLRRVPDDPAGLLRRKFRYQYSQRIELRSRRDSSGKLVYGKSGKIWCDCLAAVCCSRCPRVRGRHRCDGGPE